jgi:anti-sigma-K factor RskA
MFEQMDIYFRGKLSVDDKRAFEERLENDPTFAQNVAFYLVSKATIQDANLRQRHAKWQPNRTTSQNRNLVYPLGYGHGSGFDIGFELVGFTEKA